MRTGLQLRRPTHALGKMIHVWDLAAAHVAALTRFDALPGPVIAINLGSGTGTTVRELLAAFNEVAGA
jgi:UDP-glucose 4-epimerase